mmetsp:Transcript_12833/g.14293  ORF Transcript_12833/g.14293 Transcript_12833/m.14293 type:complete len:211 (-) Transcript_12833:71-703(-)
MIFKICLLSSIAVVVVNSQGCSICGDGKKITAPDAIFIFPGQPSVPCGALEAAGESGAIPLAECGFLPSLVTVCECASDTSVVPATNAPIVSPTDAPVVLPTDAPVVTTFTVAPIAANTETDAPATNPPVDNTLLSDAPITGPPVDAPTDSPVDAPTNSPVDAPTESPVEPSEPVGTLAKGSSSGAVGIRSIVYLLASSFVLVNLAALVL